MGRQGEGGGLKILKNEETSFMDDPLVLVHDFQYRYYTPSYLKELHLQTPQHTKLSSTAFEHSTKFGQIWMNFLLKLEGVNLLT